VFLPLDFDLVIGEIIEGTEQVPIVTRIYLGGPRPKQSLVNETNPQVPSTNEIPRHVQKFATSYDSHFMGLKDNKAFIIRKLSDLAVLIILIAQCQLVASRSQMFALKTVDQAWF
jgi:hypothetical protein